MTKGLPASGKTTWASAQIDCVRVNKDDLRAMLHGGDWSPKNEKQVLEVRDFIVADALARGRYVIVDDTNFHPKHEKRLREIAEQHGAEFSVLFFDCPVETCISRDAARVKPVGRKVITNMYREYLAPKPLVQEYDGSLPDCVIVDVDGTLADHGGIRDPFDFAKCGDDKPHQIIIDILKAYIYTHVDCAGEDLDVIIMTGAEEKFRGIRTAWLKKHEVPLDAMHMRTTGDFRPDYVIKQELYYEHIAGKYNVRFILDDRQQVVDMWRSLGLRVLQVAEGNF